MADKEGANAVKTVKTIKALNLLMRVDSCSFMKPFLPLLDIYRHFPDTTTGRLGTNGKCCGKLKTETQ